ncbi:uncharacterized protein MONBRDRAFT_25352 [Monosiga brevicollis MX1]|uniref:Uncharacterized protein n=1 Tax=Monosiga brevicollis TaxID=81824 RepID=A9UZ57_MONBE|nr:uncharacterized protein MONBRDRAFT_25352 [Monosiga brevicollis MX1]EDQ89177.1 predicted protein [Monosiga brevicollis MX1]|eukprot:XP_001745753.1 hypothetical protein [Monosiga brevicollis MX1]
MLSTKNALALPQDPDQESPVTSASDQSPRTQARHVEQPADADIETDAKEGKKEQEVQSKMIAKRRQTGTCVYTWTAFLPAMNAEKHPKPFGHPNPTPPAISNLFPFNSRSGPNRSSMPISTGARFYTTLYSSLEASSRLGSQSHRKGSQNSQHHQPRHEDLEPHQTRSGSRKEKRSKREH